MTDREALLSQLRADRDIWSHFTREEEYSPSTLDEYGRFPSRASRFGSPQQPTVSEFLVKRGLRVRFPEEHKFALCLTHDVDLLKPHSCRNFGIPRPVKRGLMRLSRKFETAWNFKRVLDLEESLGARSTFFLMAMDSSEQDFNYRLEDMSGEIGMILDRGWEIGLHGGHRASTDAAALRAEKARLEGVLGRKAVGCRNHYLKMRIPSTWRIQSEAGFEYDSTLGYADTIGFRNGMCHPFTPYDLSAEEPIDIVEIPLAVMDGSLFDHMRLDPAQAWDAVRGLVDRVLACQGILTILWHNTHTGGEMLDFYRRILQYSGEKGAWMTCGQEISRWWRTDPYGIG